MTETVIHVVGNIGTDIVLREVGAGTQRSTFRLATTPRRWDRVRQAFVDGTTNWLTVQCWRSLAVHTHTSLSRGDPVIVVGKLRTEERMAEGRRTSRLILEAIAVGHDLTRGVSVFTRVSRPVDSPPAQDGISARAPAQDGISARPPVGVGGSAAPPAPKHDCRPTAAGPGTLGRGPVADGPEVAGARFGLGGGAT